MILIFCLQIFNCPVQATGVLEIGEQPDDDYYHDVDNFINKPRKNVVSDIEPIGDELSNYPDRLYQRARRTVVFRPLFVYRQEEIRKRTVEAMRRLRDRRLNEMGQPPPPTRANTRQRVHHQHRQDDRISFDSY